MLDLVSELATLYFKVGAVIGFGIGALAQIIQGKTRDFTFWTCIVLTLFWPMLLWEAAFGERNK